MKLDGKIEIRVLFSGFCCNFLGSEISAGPTEFRDSPQVSTERRSVFESSKHEKIREFMKFIKFIRPSTTSK